MFPKISRKAFTGLLVGAIMAVMVGSILLIISYTVVGAVQGTINTSAVGPMGVISAGSTTGGVLNASYVSAQTNIVQALNIIGISLIVVGIAGLGGAHFFSLSVPIHQSTPPLYTKPFKY